MWRICVTAFICTASWFINQSVEAEQTESTTTIFAFVNFTNFTNYTTTAYTFMVPTQPHLLFVEQSQRRSNYTQMFHDTKYDRILYPTPHVLHTLFTIGQDIAKVLSKSNAYPRGFVAGNFNATLSNVMKKWPRLISHYGTIVSYLIFAAVLMAIMPLVGLVWCCHWLVWGRHRHSRGTCPRRWSTFVIFMLIILVFLACLVCVFESESSLECGIEELATTLPLVNEDLRQYFRMLQEYLDWLVSQAFTDLRNNVDSVMHGLGQMSEAVFTNETRAVAVEAINDIVSRLDFMGSLFQQAREHTNVLRTHADQFNTGLQSVKRQVLRALATCDQIECMRLRDSDKLRLLYTEIYFDEAPDLARKQNYVKEMLNSNIQRDTGDAVKVLRAIQHKVQASTSRFTPVVDKYMQQIDDHLSGIRQVIATGKDAIVNETLVLSAALDYLQYMYRRTGPFRQHVGIGVAMCLLSILVLMVWGVTCIIFGRQPASCRTDPECFDKIAGSKSLIWGIRLSFVFAGIVALTSAVYFMVAIFIQRFYCDPIMEPRNNRVVNDMFRFKKPEFFDKIGLLQEFDVVDLIERCHQNMTFIQILELEDALNEMELQNVIMSMAAWVELIPPLRLDVGKDFHFLTPAAKKKLFQCVENEVFIMDVAAYRSAVQLRVSPSELELLARELNRTARSLKRPRFEQQSRELMHASEQVTKLVHNVLRQINSNFQLPNGMTLNEAADKYKKGEMDYSELSEMNLGSEMTGGQSIVEMVLSILAAEEQVRNQSMIETQKFIDETFANLKQRVADYVVGVLYLLKHDTGRCGPVSRLYNVTAALMCNGVLLPLNGYWLSLAVCLVMLVPLTMLAKSVARFYMDVRPCPAHYQPPTSWFSKFKCCQ